MTSWMRAAWTAAALALGLPARVSYASIVALEQCSQATIVVSVSDGERPLASARVLAIGREWTTDASGQVGIEVPAGRIRVEVTADGHVPQTVDIDVAPCARAPVGILLEPLAFEEEVVVTATRTNRRLQDQPMRVEVIDREEIEEKALMTPGSVAMLLGETTGLRVQTTAPSLGAANVRIQGLRGRYSQVLSDGLPLYGAQGDSFTLLQVPPLDLGQVEVIKGAASALYGTAALGGVINLVSRRPVVRERLALANATTLGGTDLSLWIAEPARSRWGWTVLGGLHGQRRGDLDDDGWTDVAGFTRGLVRPRVFWDNRSGRSLFVTGSVMTERRDGGTIEGGRAPDGERFLEALDTTRGDVGTVVRTLVGGSRVLSVRGSLSAQQQDRQFGDVRERGLRRTWFGEATLQGASARHTWVVGGAWQQDAYRPRDLPAFTYTFNAPAVFVQDDIAFSPRVSLTASARADAHSEYGVLAAPRVSILVRPGHAWTMRATGGAGAFAPTPFTDETDETGLARVRPLSGLRAELATSASIDVSRAIGRVEIVGTLFGSRVARPLQQRVVAPDLVELVNARTPTRTIGTEIIVRYRAPGLLAMLTHAWTSSHEEDPDLGGRRDVPLTPANTVTFNVMWEGDDWGRFGVEAYYYGRQPLDDNPYRTVGRRHLLVGALAERRFGRLRVFANAENLGNVRQTRWDPLVRPERRPDGRWTVDAWAPLDGLVVNGGVRVGF